jgi:uncharacterized ferredoxin-like protein
MLYKSEESERAAILQVAQGMLAAARTAPKACGLDNIETLILDGVDKNALADVMRRLGEENDFPTFIRDAGNVDDSECIVLLAVKNSPIGLKSCGLCGFVNCVGAIKAGALCNFNVTDLGIATGSAAAMAADNRIDNRIMWTAGTAAIRMGLFSKKVRVCYGIPLSAHGKSVYYDRG